MRQYKEGERKKVITIYDYTTNPEGFDSKESFSLLYSDDDWLWFSEIFVTSKWSIRIFSENNIDAKEYVSKIIFTINRENHEKWYNHIKDFLDFTWLDYIAVWESMHSVFDFEKWFIQELL